MDGPKNTNNMSTKTCKFSNVLIPWAHILRNVCIYASPFHFLSQTISLMHYVLKISLSLCFNFVCSGGMMYFIYHTPCGAWTCTSWSLFPSRQCLQPVPVLPTDWLVSALTLTPLLSPLSSLLSLLQWVFLNLSKVTCFESMIKS